MMIHISLALENCLEVLVTICTWMYNACIVIWFVSNTTDSGRLLFTGIACAINAPSKLLENIAYIIYLYSILITIIKLLKFRNIYFNQPMISDWFCKFM